MASIAKKRSPNFSAIEINLLVSLVAKYKSIIENKQTCKTNVDRKAKIWKDIEVEFNTKSGTSFRSVDVLRKKYENIKKRTKLKSAEEKRYLYGTGGGPPKSPKPKNDVDEIMKEVIGPQIHGLESVNDSDVLNEYAAIESTAENVWDENNENCTEGLLVVEPLIEATFESEEKQKEFNKHSEEMATTSKDKFMLGRRKNKILRVSKRKMGADKWQQLADKKIELVQEKIKKAKLEIEFLKEKHQLEMKFMREKHELKCANLRSSSTQQ